jgi:hypothetical protein
MKRRKGLQRRSELQRTTPLRRTALKSSGPVKPRKPAKSREEKVARLALPKRSGGLCETQVPEACTGRATVVSHRKRRSQSSRAEKWSLTNLLHSCLPCEMHLTDHGSDSSVWAAGWTVHSSVDPASVPAFRRGQYVWLLPDGSFEPVDLTGLAALLGVVA